MSCTATEVCPTCYIQQVWHVDAPPPIVFLGWRCPGHMMMPAVAELGKEKRACTCRSKTDKIIRCKNCPCLFHCVSSANPDRSLSPKESQRWSKLLVILALTSLLQNSKSRFESWGQQKMFAKSVVILGVCNPFTLPLLEKQCVCFVLPHKDLRGRTAGSVARILGPFKLCKSSRQVGFKQNKSENYDVKFQTPSRWNKNLCLCSRSPYNSLPSSFWLLSTPWHLMVFLSSRGTDPVFCFVLCEI